MANVKAKKLTKTQITFATIGAVLFVICSVIIGWYSYIALHGKQKMTATDVSFSQLQTVTGEVANIIEVEYYANGNGNGVECLDIKWNYFSDDNHTSIYSQGLQYVANDPNSRIQWMTANDVANYYNNEPVYLIPDGEEDDPKYADYLSLMNAMNDAGAVCGGQVISSTGAWFWKENYKSYYMAPFVNSHQTSRYNYMGLYGESALGSTDELNLDSRLTIETQDKTAFYMMFKGGNYIDFPVKISASEFMADGRKIAQLGHDNIYNYYTPDYVSWLIYNSVKTLPMGTDTVVYFEFGDYFNYYKVAEGGGVGDPLNKEDSTKVINHLKSYYGIKVKVHADGARVASDSMFGVIHGSPNFTLEGATASGEYFMGRQIINCNTNVFDIVEVAEGYGALKLKQSFLDTYLPYKTKIYLSIEIDLDQMEAIGYEFVGLTKDSGISNFDILSFRSVKIVDGEKVMQEVAYA